MTSAYGTNLLIKKFLSSNLGLTMNYEILSKSLSLLSLSFSASSCNMEITVLACLTTYKVTAKIIMHLYQQGYFVGMMWIEHEKDTL